MEIVDRIQVFPPSLRLSPPKLFFLLVSNGNLHPIAEAIAFHGCKTWDLPKSLCSYILPFLPYPNLPNSRYFYVASSNGLIWINVFVLRTGNMAYVYKSFVGNPVLREWVEIPPPPDQCTTTGLVTRVDKDGIVSSFKVVRTCPRIESLEEGMYVWRVYVYSSETGTWTLKRLLSSHPINYNGSYPPVNLNGVLYLHETSSDSDPTESGVLVTYYFYGPEDDHQCQVIPLPLLYSQDVRRCLTTSSGYVFYIEILYSTFKVWRLKNNKSSESNWELLREDINMTYVDCFPMAMNPFDIDIVYLWNQQHEYLVSGNLRKQEFMIYRSSRTRELE